MKAFINIILLISIAGLVSCIPAGKLKSNIVCESDETFIEDHCVAKTETQVKCDIGEVLNNGQCISGSDSSLPDGSDSSLPTDCENIKFTWTANTEDDLDSYRLYFSDTSNNYSSYVKIDVSAPGETIVYGEVDRVFDYLSTTFFVVRAFNKDGLGSLNSDEIEFRCI